MLGSLDISIRQIRSEMGLSQSKLAALVGVSVRAIQSYEQGWREPSEIAERMILLMLIAHRNGANLPLIRCWEHKECAKCVRESCIAYNTRQGHLCWLLTGTVCEGERCKTWSEKLRMCLACSFLQTLLTRKPTTGGKEE